MGKMQARRARAGLSCMPGLSCLSCMICLSCLSVCLSVRPSVCLLVCLSVCHLFTEFVLGRLATGPHGPPTSPTSPSPASEPLRGKNCRVL